MKLLKSIAIACMACPLAQIASAQAPASAYSGQETRDIKSLSREDVDGYLAGKGMGLAKAAELNGYAGPAHVLELAAELELTPAQREKTEALFASMASKAAQLGQALVDEERRLDRMFASKSVTPELLDSSLSEIGALQASIRGAHLEAHLAQVRILTPEQNERYARLRGYGEPDAHAGNHSSHGHHE